jgi:hypothetical protein
VCAACERECTAQLTTLLYRCRYCAAPFMFILQLMVPANPPLRSAAVPSQCPCWLPRLAALGPALLASTGLCNWRRRCIGHFVARSCSAIVCHCLSPLHTICNPTDAPSPWRAITLQSYHGVDSPPEPNDREPGHAVRCMARRPERHRSRLLHQPLRVSGGLGAGLWNGFFHVEQSRALKSFLKRAARSLGVEHPLACRCVSLSLRLQHFCLSLCC